MKIHNKKSFIWGITFLCPLVLFTLGIIEAEWWQWIFTTAISAKFLYIGLSKTENDRQEYINKNYKRASQKLLGSHVTLKMNLPLIILGVFFIIATIIRYALDYIIPIWIVVVVLILATISLFYSVKLNRKIVEYIESETNPKISE